MLACVALPSAAMPVTTKTVVQLGGAVTSNTNLAGPEIRPPLPPPRETLQSRLLRETRLGHHLAAEFRRDLFAENDPSAAPVFDHADRNVPVLLSQRQPRRDDCAEGQHNGHPQRFRAWIAPQRKSQRMLLKLQAVSLRHASVFSCYPEGNHRH